MTVQPGMRLSALPGKVRRDDDSRYHCGHGRINQSSDSAGTSSDDGGLTIPVHTCCKQTRVLRQFNNPNMAARTTAAVLFATCILHITFLIWKLTVFPDTDRISDISPEVLPSAVHFRTSTSLYVKRKSDCNLNFSVKNLDRVICDRFTNQRISGSRSANSATLSI